MDIRSQTTRKNISDSFVQLLKTKPVSKITVTEICRMAHINRATFYKHYLDIPDLQEKLEQEILSDFENFLNNRSFSVNGQYRAVLVELLIYAQLYGEKFYVLCSENAASELPAKCFHLITSLSFPILKERLPEMDDRRAQLLYHYITGGSGSMMAQWLGGSTGMTVEETVDFLMMVTAGAIRAVFSDGEVEK